ncbi:MAG: hypothetical protein PUP92_35495 [Rhizonema sp. PD38]|nr:hypothetical protein [Rhizonema sp. PD38]
MQISDTHSLENRIASFTVIVVIVIFLIVTIRQGIEAALKAIAVVGAIDVIGAGALAFAGVFSANVADAVALAGARVFAGLFANTVQLRQAGEQGRKAFLLGFIRHLPPVQHDYRDKYFCSSQIHFVTFCEKSF